jgi:hypothetical protein
MVTEQAVQAPRSGQNSGGDRGDRCSGSGWQRAAAFSLTMPPALATGPMPWGISALVLGAPGHRSSLCNGSLDAAHDAVGYFVG